MNRKKTPLAIGWVYGLTVAWLAALVITLIATNTCEKAVTAAWYSLYERHLACMPANEIGDFLAGAFAPLAFLWLVATVLVQAQELTAQREELQLNREELKLTRDEMAANRGVAEATQKAIEQQAATAKESADYIGAQTVLMKQQNEWRLQDKADREADVVLKDFTGWAVEVFEKWEFPIGKDKKRTVFDERVATDCDYALKEIYWVFRNEADRSKYAPARNDPYTTPKFPPGRMETARFQVKHMYDLREKMSPERWLFYLQSGLPNMLEDITFIQSHYGGPEPTPEQTGDF